MNVLSIILNDAHEMEIVDPLKAYFPEKNPNIFSTAYVTPDGVVRLCYIPLSAIRCISIEERTDAEVEG